MSRILIFAIACLSALTACGTHSGDYRNKFTNNDDSQVADAEYLLSKFRLSTDKAHSSDVLWQLPRSGKAKASTALIAGYTGVLHMTPQSSVPENWKRYARISISLNINKSRFGKAELHSFSLCGIALHLKTAQLYAQEQKYQGQTETTLLPARCDFASELQFYLKPTDRNVWVEVGDLTITLHEKDF